MLVLERVWASTRFTMAVAKAYHDTVPDPADPTQRVAFGTSGHRGSSFRGAFNEAHILAITEAICRYRAAHGYDGPLFLGRDTHALSEPATATEYFLIIINSASISARGMTGIFFSFAITTSGLSSRTADE